MLLLTVNLLSSAFARKWLITKEYAGPQTVRKY